MIAFRLRTGLTLRIVTTIPDPLWRELDGLQSPTLKDIIPRQDSVERARGWFRGSPDSDIYLLKALRLCEIMATVDAIEERDLMDLVRTCGGTATPKAFMDALDRLRDFRYLQVIRQISG